MLKGIAIGIIGTLGAEAALFGFALWYYWPPAMEEEEDGL